MRQSIIYGCCGSRQLRAEQLDICFSIGKRIAEWGSIVLSGNADGADAAFQRGAGSRVIVALPWPSYNPRNLPKGARVITNFTPQEIDLARECHPRWEYLTPAVRSLMIRNACIVLRSDAVIAWPRLDARGQGVGGTQHTLRCARLIGKRVIDLSNRDTLEEVCKKIGTRSTVKSVA